MYPDGDRVVGKQPGLAKCMPKKMPLETLPAQYKQTLTQDNSSPCLWIQPLWQPLRSL